MKEATRRARAAKSAVTEQTAIAHALIKSLFDDGRLDELQIASFAEAGKFDETNASIAALANVPVTIAENMMIETRAEGVMILAKVAGLVVVDGEGDHQSARRSCRQRRADGSHRLQGDL